MAEHETHVHKQEERLGFDAVLERWYCSCATCGWCGPLRRHRMTAETEAALHARVGS